MELREVNGHRIAVLGEIEEGVLDQTLKCLEAEEGSVAVINGDNHLGYSQSIGVGIGYRNFVSPSGVGYDIGCGNKAVLTDLTRADLDGQVPALMDEIFARISFGVGLKNNERADHPVLDEIRDAAFEPQREMHEKATRQLGTVGGGNHYVDLFADEDGRIWIGVHFGSRGFGHTTATGFMRMASKGEDATEADFWSDTKIDDGMMVPPKVLPIGPNAGGMGWIGEAYIEAMQLAGRYAYAGRDVVVDKVLEILGATAQHEVHNHHNFAWLESHGGEDLWVVRKGCTPAFDGQEGFVGATMGEDSVILQGTPSAEAALWSTVHGAGRVMSRTKAAGKLRKVYECSQRDCSFRVRRHIYAEERQRRGLKEHERFSMCPDHPDGKMKPRKVREDGLIDWKEARAEVAAKGIELRGAAADEAPGAYKRLRDVLGVQGDTVRVLHTLTPLGVAMAPPEVPADD